MADEDSSSQEGYPFYQDPINKLVLEILRKKPVNSEHYAIFKRMKPGESFLKHPARVKSEEPILGDKRGELLLKQIGLSHGRIKKESVRESTSSTAPSLRAPGPSLGKASEIEYKPRRLRAQDPKAVFVQAAQAPQTSFRSSIVASDLKKNKAQSARPTEHQVSKYLQYLEPKDKEKSRFVKKEVEKKFSNLNSSFRKRVEEDVQQYNKIGIFNENVNRARAQARMAVRVKAAAVLYKDKFTTRAHEEFSKKPPPSASDDSESFGDHKEELLRQIESTIAKNVTRTKKSERTAKNNKDWERDIKKTVDSMMVKCTPPSKILDIPVCKLDLASS